MKRFLLFSIGVIFCLSAFSAENKDQEILRGYFAHSEIFEAYTVQKMRSSQLFSDAELARQARLIAATKFFLETPYVASTLEINDEEQLVVNLRELDCVTLVENVIALTRTLNTGNRTIEQFKQELQFIRYRDGIIDGYPSRLHYFSDWLLNNSQNDILTDITKEIGGEPIRFNVNIISSRPDSYKALKNRPDYVEKIKQIEQKINSQTFYFIPQDRIDEKRNKIRNGDIICFVTSNEGLDISHVGIAYHTDDKLTFIHASLTARKVIVDPNSIADYVAGISHNTGIIVLRVN